MQNLYKKRAMQMQQFVGMGFENIEKLQKRMTSLCDNVNVSELHEPNTENGDEFVFVEFENDNEFYTLFLAQGKSGRYYIVEVA